MRIDETRFHALADAILERIAEAVDSSLGDDIDVDSQGGIVTLSLAGGGQYVLNKHAPNREVWLSSPVSGAWHFAPAEDGEWVSTREPKARLRRLLADELTARFGSDPGF
jgi:frataxin